MKNKILLALALVSGVAIACEYLGEINAGPAIEVKSRANTTEQWEEIGKEMERRFGSQYTAYEVSFRIQLKTSFLGITGTNYVHLLKPCDKTVKEAAQAVAATVADTGGDGPGGGGDFGDWGDGGYAGTGPFDNCYTEFRTACATVGEGSDSDTSCGGFTELICPMG